MKAWLFCIGVSFLFFSCAENTDRTYHDHSVTSFSGKIRAGLQFGNNSIQYYVLHEEDTIVGASELGFILNDSVDLSDNLVFNNYSENEFHDTWELVWGEKDSIVDEYREISFNLGSETHSQYDISVFMRVYNDGVAFRYELTDSGSDSIFITEECSGFSFVHNPDAWWIPADYDSYEKLYSCNKLSSLTHVATPLTLQYGDSLYVSVHEAALTDYAGMTLKQEVANSTGLVCDLVPWADGILVRGKGRIVTPWRTITIAESAGQLLESDLIVKLNEPCKIPDVTWIRPMKYIGIWWGMHLGTHTWTPGERHGATTANMKRYIDFAAENSIEAVLAEGWNTGWEKWGQQGAFDFVTPYSDFNLLEVCNYAKEKGIQIVGHHETGGDVIAYEAKLDEAFNLYNSLGVHAVKTGYAGGINPRGEHHHGQYMVRHYRKVVETAARYQLMLDVHEPIKPTGIRRTYPNMMTREGVRGMEWNAWSDGNPPEHTCIIPFTRGLAGPIDYTPGIFDVSCQNFSKDRIPWNCENISKTRVHTTTAKQLALLVVLYSPMQMAGDLVENYENNPAFEFISKVHVNWDETKVIDARIGDYVVIARRKGKDWFIGAITDEQSREIVIPADFLNSGSKYNLSSFSDGGHWLEDPGSVIIEKHPIICGDTLRFVMKEGGGFAAIISAELK